MLPAPVYDDLIVEVNWDHQGYGVEVRAKELEEQIAKFLPIPIID